MDGRPPPAPAPPQDTTTPKPTRRSPNEDLAARTAPQPSGHPNPSQASSTQLQQQPIAGNNNRSRENSQLEMEAFIRQWGASTNDISDFSLSPGLGGWASTSSGFDLVGNRSQSGSIIRTDRSASFDNNESDANNNVGRNNTASVANSAVGQPNNVQRCATFDNGSQQHRRISSTGGDNRQQAISVNNNSASIPQHLFDGLVLGGGATDDINDPQNPNSNTNSTMDNILNGAMSALHDAARITDWDSVAALSTSNPESAKYVGPDGWNALHHACDRRCPHVDVIDLLLNAHPEAIIQTNDKGWTPLHRACRNKTSKDVVKLLLNKYIELGNRAASMRCNDGRSALHYALLYDAPEGVVDLLLAADPQAVLDEDRDGVSPLGTVWDKYANTFEGRRMLQVLLKQFDGEGWELGSSAGGSGSSSTQDVYNREQLEARQQKNHKQASEEETAERIKAAEKRARDAMEKTSPACKVLQTNWNKANTLLRAYFRFPLQEEDKSTADDVTTPESTTAENITTTTGKRKWRILHAVSSIKCHPKLFLLARALHPEQALEVDENDLYANGRATGESSSSSSSDAQSPQPSQRTALHFAAMSPLTGKEGRNVVKVLLKLNPNAASHVDGYGSLPLHLICENVRRLHWTNFGPLDIHNAYPEATSCIDGSGKTPLHCASASSGQYMSFYPRPVSAAGLPVVSEEESVIRNLVEANGTAASIADNTGRLPLHYIAEGLENWSADVQAVLDAHPTAAQTRAGPSTSNQLPLHMAASSPDARPPLIMGILGANPRAASIVDGKGRLPLHLAVDSGRTTWDNGIASIYMAYTPAISKLEESPRRWTVLHAAAASKSAGCDLIKAIISLAKNTASVQDSDGRYPLHLACASNRSWEDGGMRDIFDADPSAALSEDVHGLLPFHIAAMRGSTIPPTTNNSTPSSAITESEQADNDDLESLEVLFVLLRSQPSIVQL